MTGRTHLYVTGINVISVYTLIRARGDLRVHPIRGTEQVGLPLYCLKAVRWRYM